MFVNDREVILAEVERLNNCLAEERLDLRILPGADVHVNYNVLDLIREGKAMTVNDNGKYILLEFPHQLVPPRIPELVFQLKLQGITPIFTHPERNSIIQRDVNIMVQLVEQGALSQITAQSVTGEFGPQAYRCAVELLQCNLAHVIATDAHSSHIRTPVLSESVRKASEITGQQWADAMVSSIPQAIIEGKTLLDLPDPVQPKRSFFKRIFR